MAERIDMNSFVGPTEYEQEEPYLSDSPVFKIALERQAELDKHQFPTVKAALAAGNKICAELDRMANETSLMGATATIKGPEILAPTPVVDPLNETSYLTINKVTSDIWGDRSLTGGFMGFGTAIKGVYEEDNCVLDHQPPKLVSAKVRINYMIMGPSPVSTLTAINATLCAHGPIDTSVVEFALDTYRREAARALGVIARLTVPDAQFFAHNLNALVKPGKHRYTCLRSLGHMVRHFVERNYDDLYDVHKDAILDFIKARLRLDSGDRIEVEADAASIEPDIGPHGVLGKIDRLSTELNDLAFAPYAFHGAMAKDTALERAPRLNVHGKRATTPALVTPWVTSDPSDSFFLYIPFERIRKLK